jgi:MFS transporter, UMF2 family, putative MFS family transporter protein
LDNIVTNSPTQRTTTPVIALSLYAVASGYLMSLIPLVLSNYGISTTYASWLASGFYAGLLFGALGAEQFVRKLGHKRAFIWSLLVLIFSIIALPSIPNPIIWLMARFIAGTAVAGIFVVVESWLLHGDEKKRAKRLGLYMTALYGGTALGQLGIGYIGVKGSLPFASVIGLLLLATLVLMLFKSDQPQANTSSSLSFKQIAKLSHAAMIGCLVSGLALGAIYGLMPVELVARGVAQQELGPLMALVILGGMAVQPVVPWLSRYMGRTLLMAFFSLIGTSALVITLIDFSLVTLAISLFVIGFAVFSLYPIAINLGCDNLNANYIVSATQVMLLSYSVGSVIGPVIADRFMSTGHSGLMFYLAVILLATCIYMLLSSIKSKRQLVSGE